MIGTCRELEKQEAGTFLVLGEHEEVVRCQRCYMPIAIVSEDYDGDTPILCGYCPKPSCMPPWTLNELVIQNESGLIVETDANFRDGKLTLTLREKTEDTIG